MTGWILRKIALTLGAVFIAVALVATFMKGGN